MSISKFIPEHIKQVSRSIGYVIWLNSTDNWLGLRSVLRARLDEQQLAALACVALTSLDRDNAVQVVEGALRDGAGQPVTPLLNCVDEAAFWADMATNEELEAYCLASFMKMHPARRVAFLEYVQGRAAA